MNISLLPVSRTEPDDNEAVPRAGRRGEGIRAGAQVARPGADALPGAQARRGGRAPGRRAGRLALPEGARRHHRPRAQQDQIVLPTTHSTTRTTKITLMYSMKGIHSSNASRPRALRGFETDRRSSFSFTLHLRVRT